MRWVIIIEIWYKVSLCGSKIVILPVFLDALRGGIALQARRRRANAV